MTSLHRFKIRFKTTPPYEFRMAREHERCTIHHETSALVVVEMENVVYHAGGKDIPEMAVKFRFCLECLEAMKSLIPKGMKIERRFTPSESVPASAGLPPG